MKFTTSDYQFQVDEARYVLPEFTVDHYEGAITSIYGAESQNQPTAMRDFMLKHAADKRTKDAIRKLGLRNQAQLFREWAGMGDSEGESAATTD